MRSISLGILSLFIALTVLTASSSSSAQSMESSALVHEGIELRRVGSDQEALRRFQRAWDLDHQPIAQAQIGLAYQALGQWVDAERSLRLAMAQNSDGWIQRNRGALDQAYTVVQGHLGTLEIRGGVSGARVLINGAQVATLPAAEPIHVVAGAVTLEISADGYYTDSRRMIVEPGQTSRESVDLRAMESAHRVVRLDQQTTAPPTHSSRGVSVGGIVLIVIGAVCAGAGIGVGVGPVQSLSHGGDEGLYNVGVGSEYALFIVGAAALIGGVALQFTGSHENPRSATRISWGLASNGMGGSAWIRW